MAPVDAENDLAYELSVGRNIALATITKYFSRLPREEAEDIAQDLCIAYWQQRSRILVFQAWFYTAARSRAISALRRHQPAREVTEKDASTAEPPDVRQEAIRQIFFTLRDHCRQLLGCLVIAEWSLPKLAKAISRDVERLNEQRSRCLKLLRHRWLEANAAKVNRIPLRLADLEQARSGGAGG